MALTEGHQLGRLLVQNLWKVLGAFGLGLVAVVGGGLLLSDVHRIPQRNPSAATPMTPLSAKSEAPSQQASEKDNHLLPAEINGIVPDSQTPDQNSPARGARRKHPRGPEVAKLPNPTSQSLAVSPPSLPSATESLPGPIAQLASTPASSAPAVLRLTAETPITVRLTEQISSKENHKGEVFKGTLALPLTANGVVIAHSGAQVIGRIVDARNTRLFRGGSYLNLELTQVEGVDGRPLRVKTMQWYETGSHSRVVKAAILPNEAAKKAVSGVISGVKGDEDANSNHPEQAMAPQSSDTDEKSEKKKGTVALPPGSEVVFRLAEPLTINGSLERR